MLPPDDNALFWAIEAETSLPAESLEFAKKEEDALADGKKAVQKEVNGIAIRALRYAAILIGILFTVRILHIVLPETWRWLSIGDLQGMDKMLFSSAFGGLVLGYLKEIMKPLPK